MKRQVVLKTVLHLKGHCHYSSTIFRPKLQPQFKYMPCHICIHHYSVIMDVLFTMSQYQFKRQLVLTGGAGKSPPHLKTIPFLLKAVPTKAESTFVKHLESGDL